MGSDDRGRRKVDFQIDVSGRTGLRGTVLIAATAHVPAGLRAGDHVPIVVAVPGGGYTRHYFDIGRPWPEGYSQARHHNARGVLLVTIDHVGVGDSTNPAEPSTITFDIMAEALAAASRDLLERIRGGTLAAGIPALRPTAVIGQGQSMGGCVITVTQARHRIFDGVCLLGWSGRHTILPSPDRPAADLTARDVEHPGLSELEKVRGSIPDFRYPYFMEDVQDSEVVQADLDAGLPVRTADRPVPAWASTTLPPCALSMLTEGCVAQQAASITVPVFIGVGGRDVCAQPHREPEAYPASSDVTLSVIAGMAHMHNFATTRAQLWERLITWYSVVPKTR